MMAVVKTSDHFCMKQQINKRDSDKYTVCTYSGEALNHNIQLRIFCFLKPIEPTELPLMYLKVH